MEGNQMKIREAIEEILLICYRAGARYGYDVACGLIKSKAKKALSEPPRNCDVGTAEEQAERMRLYCNSHGEDESGCFRCEECPFLTDERCELTWAQMPYDVYEKGECDEQK